jgi:predicted methyltransferase
MMKLAHALSVRALLLLSPVVAASCATTRSETPAAPAAGAPTPAAASAPAGADANKLRAILAMPHRDEKARHRDQYRHPIETLSFFGVRDDMNVVEIWPGGGWYTDVLAPYLKDKGKLAVTNTDSEGGKKFGAKLAANPDVYGKVEVRIIAPPDKIDFGPEGSADVVLTFRNVHGWLPKNYDDKVYAAAYRVLKSGGVFGVVEHRAKPGSDPAELKDTGYVPEEFVIKRVQEAGFRLAEKSEINANPKDTKDHPKGVWTLPPSLRLGEQDKEKYLAIGESDRMTLKFVKP